MVLLAVVMAVPYCVQDWNMTRNSLIGLSNTLTAAVDRYLLLDRKQSPGLLIQACSNMKKGNPALDITTVVLGLYTTFVAYVVLGYLERHCRAPVVRFLTANFIGAGAAVAAAAAGFGWAGFINYMRQYV